MDVGQVLLGLLGIAATALLGWMKSDLAQIRKDIAAERERGHQLDLRLAVLEERAHGA